MKKNILLTYNNPSFKFSEEVRENCQNIITVILENTDDDTQKLNLPVLTYKLDSYDMLSREMIEDLKKSEEHQTLVISKDGASIINREIMSPVTFSLTPKQKIIMELLSKGFI